MPDPYLNPVALLAAVVVGVTVHEVCHGLVCAWYGWPHTLLFVPPLKGGSRLRTLASGIVAACRHDTMDYLREPARRRRRVALAPLLVSVPLFGVLLLTTPPPGPGAIFLSFITASTIPSITDWKHALTFNERRRTWWQVEIGEQCINHGRVEGFDCRRPW